MRPQMDAAQNKAARSDARTSPAVPPGTEGGPSRPRRSRPVSQHREAEQQGQESAAARATAAAAALQKLVDYGGSCWWCHKPAHDPDTCAAKPKPDMDDWTDAHAPPREGMRSRPQLDVSGSSNMARAQTTRTAEEQRDFRSAYKLEWQRRKRALEDEAQQRALSFHRECSEPLVGAGPCGAFTVYQLLAIEFAVNLESHLSAAQLARAALSVDAAAVQVFAKLLDGRSAAVQGATFKKVADAREPGEPAITAFTVLRARCLRNEAETRALIAFGVKQERRKHGSSADVTALADGASLLTVLRASQKKPGAPKKGTAAAASDAGLSIASNWAAGGFTPEAIQARAEFDTRRVSVSQKETQADVLQATKLIINGAPTSVTALRAFRPRSKLVS